MYKDSEVFALEGYVETILNEGEWKDCHKIKEELESLDEVIVKEEYIDNVMDRLCTLFPMKYQKQGNPEHYYKRNYSFKKGNEF